MTDSANESPSPPWYKSTAILSSSIKGIFGLLCAIIGYYTVVHEPTQPMPTQTTVTPGHPMVIQPDRSVVKAAMPTMTTISPPQARPQRPPNLLLNFAAFQARLASPEVSTQERAKTVRPLLNRTVIWKGYVDDVSVLSSPTDDATVTVSLVESEEKLSQSMFKAPAHCRFSRDHVDAVAALEPGDLVTISGTLSDHNVVATNITAAHLMSINGRPLSKMATKAQTESVR